MSKKTDLISVVIACYKDAESIPIMYKRIKETFKKLSSEYEIIFVNDGSPDNTTEVLEKICSNDKNVKAIIHSRNFSSQNAFTSGMQNASGDAVIIMDGDLQDPPELIEDFYFKAGFVKRGTFPGRDKDTVAFVYTEQHYSHDAIEDQFILRNLNEGSGRPASMQAMMELSYGIHVNDNIRIQPNIHYIVNPDQFGDKARQEDLSDAVVLGLRFDINLAGLLFQ